MGSAARSKCGYSSIPTRACRSLQELYREWPFFRTLLSNMDMVLAKSSIAIASRYAELVAGRGIARTDFRDGSGANGIRRS